MFLLLPAPIIQQIYLLVTSIIIGYIHRDICIYMLYQRVMFLFLNNVTAYQIITSCRLFPLSNAVIEEIPEN